MWSIYPLCVVLVLIKIVGLRLRINDAAYIKHADKINRIKENPTKKTDVVSAANFVYRRRPNYPSAPFRKVHQLFCTRSQFSKTFVTKQ